MRSGSTGWSAVYAARAGLPGGGLRLAEGRCPGRAQESGPGTQRQPASEVPDQPATGSRTTLHGACRSAAVAESIRLCARGAAVRSPYCACVLRGLLDECCAQGSGDVIAKPAPERLPCAASTLGARRATPPERAMRAWPTSQSPLCARSSVERLATRPSSRASSHARRVACATSPRPARAALRTVAARLLSRPTQCNRVWRQPSARATQHARPPARPRTALARRTWRHARPLRLRSKPHLAHGGPDPSSDPSSSFSCAQLPTPRLFSGGRTGHAAGRARV
jgi:hypothetical protein